MLPPKRILGTLALTSRIASCARSGRLKRSCNSARVFNVLLQLRRCCFWDEHAAGGAGVAPRRQRYTYSRGAAAPLPVRGGCGVRTGGPWYWARCAPGGAP